MTEGYLTDTCKSEQQLLEERRSEYERVRAQRIRWKMTTEENVLLFLREGNTILFDPEGSIPSRELFELYQQWCIRNNYPDFPIRKFCLDLKKYAPQFSLSFSGSLRDRRNHRCRGYLGIREWKNG